MLMDIDLSNLSEGQSCNFSYTFDVGGLVGERLVVFSEPTRVDGSYVKIGGDLVVKARIFVSAVFNCDRCLTEVKREFSTPANVVFKNKADAFCGESFGNGVFKDKASEGFGADSKGGAFKDKATEGFGADSKSGAFKDKTAESFGGISRKADNFGGDGYFYEGTTVNLDEMFREKFILSFPEYVVCKPDCKGLCPNCGCDLNTNQCNCQENQNGDGGGNSFAALRDISSGGKNGGTKKKNF
jgi:uncharacterized metal-binding protein YceD (DUF177 family)